MKLLSLAAVVYGLGLTTSAKAEPIEAVLRVNGRVPMETLARSVLDPASPRYRQFYTPQEIRALVGPTDAEYQGLLDSLTAEGLSVVGESPSHLLVTVSGERETLQHLFMPEGKMAIPTHLSAVVSVTGLEKARRSRPHIIVPRDPANPFGGGVEPKTIRKLYGFDALYARGITGKGQHIAVATYNDVDLSVISAFYTKFAITPAPVVDKVTFNGAAPADQNSAMETAVDAEFSGALAPGAQIHIFTSAKNDDGGELALFTAILDDNRAKIANYSWGDCEVNISAQHKTDMAAVFQRAVAQGVNIMVASGDSGSACPTTVDSSGQPSAYTDPMADWPAARPDVVAIGGTTIDVNAATLSETAWSGTGAAGGGGGGVSTLWDRPTWQSALDSARYAKRSYPDVSFNANPASGQTAVISFLGFPLPTSIGGTSIAAPQWSGFMALVGEARATANKPQLGFLNPVIYAMPASAKATALNDITSGNNGHYTAAAGWDAATGWGSLNAGPMLDYLVAH